MSRFEKRFGLADRRQVLIGAATVATSLACPVGSFEAQAQLTGADALARVVGLEKKASDLGVFKKSASKDGLAASADPDNAAYRKLKARLLALVTEAESKGETGEQVAIEADELLGKLLAAERSKKPATGILSGFTAVKAPKFNEGLRADYRSLFDTCKTRSKYQSDIATEVKFLRSEVNRARYKAVEAASGVPWYFVGIVHSLECSSRFRAHLHNGDLLTARTWQEPPGRPKIWPPPSDWKSSAVDALDYEAQIQKRIWGPPDDWSLERMLFRFESYNGWGYRPRKMASPYLWSFSQHYTRGKYKFDGKYDPTLVSEQAGAAVILSDLIKSGDVARPKNWTA